jgi:glycosyltransferase involved in cell wall biosynthesis
MIDKTEQEIMKNWKLPNEKPKVSICCITYNHEPYITDALDGFLMQKTDFPFEIIVRDDFSTDKTAQIIREYEQKYPTIIKPIYETENGYRKGIKATPIVLKKAKGEYIALCEGDDYWTDTSKLQQQVNFLTSNLDYSACHHACSKVADNKQIIQQNILELYKDYSEQELLTAGTEIATNTLMFRNCVEQDEIKKFSKIINGDTVLFHLLGFHGKAKFIDTIKNSAYRIHSGGVWSAISTINRVNSLMDCHRAIKKNLITGFPNNLNLMYLIDSRVEHNFKSCFMHFFYARDFPGYLSCLQKLSKQSDFKRVKIYLFHLNHLKNIIINKFKRFFGFRLPSEN